MSITTFIPVEHLSWACIGHTEKLQSSDGALALAPYIENVRIETVADLLDGASKVDKVEIQINQPGAYERFSSYGGHPVQTLLRVTGAEDSLDFGIKGKVKTMFHEDGSLIIRILVAQAKGVKL